MIVLDILKAIWEFFATYVLQKAPYMVGFLTLLGYALMGKKWYDCIAGTLKAIIGMLILNAGSSGLTSTFRPILAGLKDRFNLTACVIDPYYGQNAVQEAMEAVGKSFADTMMLLLIAFIINILLVRFNKITKCRTLFTTGHVQVQQAATALWLLMFALPQLAGDGATVSIPMMIVMAVLLGAYWAVGSNMTVKPLQELTDGAGFAIAHQQMFGIRIAYILADKLFGERKDKDGKVTRKIKKVGDMEMPGFFSIFNENMVCTAILMTVFFGIIMAVIGKPYFVENQGLAESTNFVWFCFDKSLNFAVYLAILQLGVRTFVTELTASFQGIADKLLPSSIPGVDCAVCYGFGDANAVTFGFLAGLCGQLLAIILLIVLKSPT
ncbi:MAG: PTS transporter subunit IIC, partial [Candidatus Onthomonas sp.]